MTHSFAKITLGLGHDKLNMSSMAAEPLSTFDTWIQHAVRLKITMPNAFCLSTSDQNNQPDARIVLLMDYSDEGMIFFTNYTSAKGQQLANNPQACMLFFWPELERQIRIKGLVHKTSVEQSDAYFASRPKEAQLSAAASPQSAVIPNYEYLLKRKTELEGRCRGAIPRPGHWGGYCLAPQSYEFWQGGPDRLHDCILYRQAHGQWIIERLAP